MSEFADRLSNQLGRLVHRRDEGLKGKYDFDLTWGETMPAPAVRLRMETLH